MSSNCGITKLARLTDTEIADLLPNVPTWEIVEEQGMKRLTRTFQFDDFVTALAFTNSVGEIAERHDHHPRIMTEWGRVNVTWWSHEERGIVTTDFDMAMKIDAR